MNNGIVSALASAKDRLKILAGKVTEVLASRTSEAVQVVERDVEQKEHVDWRGRDAVDQAGEPLRAPDTKGLDRAVDADTISQSTRHALDTAVASRMNDGGVNPAVLEHITDGLPRIHIEAADGTVDVAAIKEFAGTALGRDDIELRPVIGGGLEGGRTGDPVYLIKDRPDSVVAVAKVFRSPEMYVRELSGTQVLSAPEFTRFDVPEIHGVAVTSLNGKDAEVLVMSVAPGRSIINMIHAVADAPTDAARATALDELGTAMSDTGAALGELHSRPVGSGGAISRAFADTQDSEIHKDLGKIVGHRDVLREFGVDAGDLAQRVTRVLPQGWGELGGSAITHGDANPGNIFWHPDNGVTFIDNGNAHLAVDGMGRPIGAPAYDVTGLRGWTNYAARTNDFSAAEIDGLNRAFTDGYRAGGGPVLSAESLRGYGARLGVWNVMDAAQQVGADTLRTKPELARTLRDAVDGLNETLEWTS
ncbi:MAG: aminoglycoside phosphotransferase [Nocardia sp.]|uniref:aminoglycoside phosphotransferase family protein n=1 Tax=Nocardia sp. TaxID=1821 RepID=UPI0026137236|nr:aminoglycoside phosphotransferase family protein [Nocardia sp.]MCU1644313.1 aminoglycoside phosphotransferase [Nocardia sp.]